MKFTPKTDKEIAEANLWQPGNYSFEIIEGTDKISKNDNEMIELKLKVYNEAGNFILLNDYLLETLAYKLKHACDACGLSDNYAAGSLSGMDFVGKCGVLKLKIQKGKKKDDGSDEFYADKNSISDYVVKKDGEAADGPPLGHPASASIADDTIPF